MGDLTMLRNLVLALVVLAAVTSALSDDVVPEQDFVDAVENPGVSAQTTLVQTKVDRKKPKRKHKKHARHKTTSGTTSEGSSGTRDWDRNRKHHKSVAEKWKKKTFHEKRKSAPRPP